MPTKGRRAKFWAAARSGKKVGKLSSKSSSRGRTLVFIGQKGREQKTRKPGAGLETWQKMHIARRRCIGAALAKLGAAS
ncbi:hypothetical protein GCM10027048_35140 [Hymenobacter coalescens]